MAKIVEILDHKCYWQQVATRKDIKIAQNMNQWSQSGVTQEKTALVYGHKYYVSFNSKYYNDSVVARNQLRFKMGNSGYGEFEIIPAADGFNEKLQAFNSQGGVQDPRYYIQTYEAGYIHLDITDIQIFDLTVMYGEGNEPSTIADFKKDFKFKYYGYNILNN